MCVKGEAGPLQITERFIDHNVYIHSGCTMSDLIITSLIFNLGDKLTVYHSLPSRKGGALTRRSSDECGTRHLAR